MYKLEHIGIAVKSLDKSDGLFQRLIGVPSYKHETIADQLVTTSFFRTGDVKLELLEATSSDSPIHKFIEKRGEGIHHIAFEVEDILAAMQRLASEGFQLLQDEPSRGADNKWVCFLHPHSCNGVLVEICQSMDQEGNQMNVLEH